MNQPPKKPLKTMRRGAVIALCISCAAVLCFALWLLNRPPKFVLLPNADTSSILSSRALDELVSVTVENESGRYVCLYRDQTLTLENAPDTALDASYAAELLNCCQKITALDTVLDTAETDVHLHDFGLENPSTVTAAYTDGTSVTLMIGDLTPASIPSHYAMIAGDSHIYTVDPYFYEAARLTAESLRAFEQLSLNADLIDAVKIDGAVTLDARLNGEFWQMTSPYVYPMDAAKTQTLLDNIENMRFASCLGRADELHLSDYGLDAPQVTLSVTQARSYVSATDENGNAVTVEIPETTYTVLIGGMRGDTMYYALYNGDVYTTGILTTDYLMTFNAENLLNRNPVSFPETNLTSLTLQKDGETTRYTVALVESVLPNNELETDEYGNIVYRFAVTRDGQAIDSEAFLVWYARLVAMQARGLAKENVYRDKPVELTITVSTAENERTLDFYPYDSSHYACRLNSVTLFNVDGDLNALYAEKP